MKSGRRQIRAGGAAYARARQRNLPFEIAAAGDVCLAALLRIDLSGVRRNLSRPQR
jgi:hypothetical protein